MNEQVMNEVVTNYAIETANLRIQVATLNAKVQELEAEANAPVEDTEDVQEFKEVN